MSLFFSPVAEFKTEILHGIPIWLWHVLTVGPKERYNNISLSFIENYETRIWALSRFLMAGAPRDLSSFFVASHFMCRSFCSLSLTWLSELTVLPGDTKQWQDISTSWDLKSSDSVCRLKKMSDLSTIRESLQQSKYHRRLQSPRLELFSHGTVLTFQYNLVF